MQKYDQFSSENEEEKNRNDEKKQPRSRLGVQFSARACLLCKEKHVKCDSLDPCQRCRESQPAMCFRVPT